MKHSLGITFLIENGVRLKQSFAWDLIVDRSMTVCEVGRITRSHITVNISGSAVCKKRNNDGSECMYMKEGSGKCTKELIQHLAQVSFCLKCGIVVSASL